MPLSGRKLEPPRSVGRRRVVPVKPTSEVETAVPEVQGAFVVRHNYGSKSALDHPDMPLFRSMGPGTPEWHKTVTILPIDPPNKDLVDTFNASQRSLANQYKKQAKEMGGPLSSPRMAMPVPPATARPSTSSREVPGNSLILDGTLRLSTPRSARESEFNSTETGLPPLFTGGRTKAQHRHLLAFNKDGDRFKPIAAAPPAAGLHSAHGSLILSGSSAGAAAGTTSKRLGSHGPTSTLLPPSRGAGGGAGFDDHLPISPSIASTSPASAGGFGGKPTFGTAANNRNVSRTPGSRGATPPPQHLQPPALGGLAPPLLPKSPSPRQSTTGSLLASSTDPLEVSPDAPPKNISSATPPPQTTSATTTGGATQPVLKEEDPTTAEASAAPAPGTVLHTESKSGTSNGGAATAEAPVGVLIPHRSGGGGGPMDPSTGQPTPSSTATNTPIGGLATQSVDDTASQLSYAAKFS